MNGIDFVKGIIIISYLSHVYCINSDSFSDPLIALASGLSVAIHQVPLPQKDILTY